MNHASLRELIPEVLKGYGLTLNAAPEPVAGGTLNWNFSVEAGAGRYFLRRYRDDSPVDRIIAEHELLAWVANRGLPAPRPLPLTTGGTVCDLKSGHWALFPWARGFPSVRGSLTPERARALGQAHGQVQSVLAHHPGSQGARIAMRWDKSESLRLLEQVRLAAQSRETEPWLLPAIERQHDVLARLDVLPPEAFTSLPCQLLHGDFHDGQVLWVGDEVSAVVDWELFRDGPRVWELIRSLAFSELIDSLVFDNYLRGYREHIQLAEDEVRLGLRLWWQSRVVGLWTWSAYFLQGNERVGALLRATAADLDRAIDEEWKARLAERFVNVACR